MGGPPPGAPTPCSEAGGWMSARMSLMSSVAAVLGNAWSRSTTVLRSRDACATSSDRRAVSTAPETSPASSERYSTRTASSAPGFRSASAARPSAIRCWRRSSRACQPEAEIGGWQGRHLERQLDRVERTAGLGLDCGRSDDEEAGAGGDGEAQPAPDRTAVDRRAAGRRGLDERFEDPAANIGQRGFLDRERALDDAGEVVGERQHQGRVGRLAGRAANEPAHEPTSASRTSTR